MKNSLVMMRDTSFALNFLIYIQNIFLNQIHNEEKVKFPYISTRMAFKSEFEIKYKALWDEISQRIRDDNRNGAIPFYGERDLFYQRLFMNDEDSLMAYNETYKTFEVWWNSFAGYFTIGRSIDEMEQKLYYDFADLLVQKGTKPQRQLNISLIYDKCLLADTKFTSYFAVLPIRDFFFNYEELVSKLEICID